jgi:hypothetical protein
MHISILGVSMGSFTSGDWNESASFLVCSFHLRRPLMFLLLRMSFVFVVFVVVVVCGCTFARSVVPAYRYKVVPCAPLRESQMMCIKETKNESL